MTNNKICVLGDLHFRTDLWWNEVASRFLSWFEKYDFGPRDSISLIQLGDVTDKDSNPGDVIDLVDQFASICEKKFHETLILIGNHDKKIYKGKTQYSFKFLKNRQSIRISEKPGIEIVGGKKILLLPFIREDGIQIDEYYSTGLDPKFYDIEYDLMVGHISGKEKGMKFGGVELERFKTKRRALGHIHDRYDDSQYRYDYTGSIAPFKVDENNAELQRCIKVFDNEMNLSEITIPSFIEYCDIRFPDPIQKIDDQILRVYTVLDCKNLQKARGFYTNHYIRAIEKTQKNDEIIGTDTQIKTFRNKTEAYREWIKENKITPNRRVHQYILDSLR
jgi:hypothetical protein